MWSIAQIKLAGAGLPTLPGEVRPEQIETVRRAFMVCDLRMAALSGAFRLDPS